MKKILFTLFLFVFMVGGKIEATTFTDNFANGINISDWTVSPGLFTIDDTQGDIRISKVVGGGGEGEWCKIFFNHTVYGDFDISVTYRDAVLGPNSWDQVQLNMTFGGQYLADRRECCGQRYSVWLDPPQSTNGVVYTSDTSGVLRVTRIGKTVTCYGNGTQLYQASFNDSPVNNLWLSLQNNQNSNAISVTFDDFSIIADGIDDKDHCTPKPDGIISWWGGDNNALDIIGENNGTLLNGATYKSGKVGQSFSFDGSDDYFTTGGNVGDFGSYPFTVDFWIYSNNNGNNTYLLGKSSPDSGLGWDIRLNNQSIQVVGVNGWDFNITSDQSATSGRWHNIALSSTNSEASLYIDGILKGTSNRQSISSTTNPFNIGYTTNFGGTRFSGQIDEIVIFDRALSLEEIGAIYNSSSGGICRPVAIAPDGIVSLWKGENNPYDELGLHQGVEKNGATYSEGKVGYSFKLDGINDYIEIPAFNMWTDWSLMGWFKAIKASNGSIAPFFNRSSNNYDGLTFDHQLSTKKFGFNNGTGSAWQVNGGSGMFSSPNYYPGSLWNFLALTKSCDTVKMYVNGAFEVESTTSNFSEIYQDRQLRLGYWYYGTGESFTGGCIDEVAIFNRALTTEEIQKIYNASSSGMAVYFNLNVAVSGNGTVFSNPEGIDCGANCLKTFPLNTSVTLTAQPQTGYYFEGWGGDCSSCATNPQCVVAMNSAKRCTATFSVSLPGEASKAGFPMTATSGTGTSVNVSFTPSNCATDHTIYWGEGPISGSLNWSNAICGIGTTGSASFNPGTSPSNNFFYFVVVGNNGTKEGSYGKSLIDGVETERPEATGLSGCDWAQQLTGACD